jgi:hypothetical protein
MPGVLELIVLRARLRLSEFILLAFCVALPALAFSASAGVTRPTALEWMEWPDYCRAKWSTHSGSRQDAYARQIPRSEVEAWAQRLGPRTFESMHHYCAGLLHEGRAMRISDPTGRRRELQRAHAEYSFTLNRARNEKAPFLPTVDAAVRRIEFLIGPKPVKR